MSHAPSGVRRALLVLAGFQLVSSLAGGVLGVFLDGAGVPHAWLERTPFSTFVWPGVILAVVVGGAQGLALVAQRGRYRLAGGIHAAAGLVMMTWIFAEIALMLVWSPLQGIYFATGLAQVALAVIALGAWPHPLLGREERP